MVEGVTYQLPGNVQAWETVAAIVAARSAGRVDVCYGLETPNESIEICRAFGYSDYRFRMLKDWPFGDAFRMVDQGRAFDYIGALISLVGSGSTRALSLPGDGATTDEIIVCSEPLKKDFAVPRQSWVEIVRLLKTYGYRVTFMGDRGQRVENYNLPEGDLLSDLPVKDKLERLRRAALVVGVPNAWTWLATAWNKPQLILYPETQAVVRDGDLSVGWFPLHKKESVRWLLTSPGTSFLPVLLMGIRKQMGAF